VLPLTGDDTLRLVNAGVGEVVSEDREAFTDWLWNKAAVLHEMLADKLQAMRCETLCEGQRQMNQSRGLHLVPRLNTE
jgi:hypothetical protein